MGLFKNVNPIINSQRHTLPPSTRHCYSKYVILNFTVGDSHLLACNHLKQSKTICSYVSLGEMQDHYDKLGNKVELI